MAYAEKTTVATGATLSEIETVIDKYGATGFAFGRSGSRVAVSFEMHQRRVKFTLTLPAPDERRFTHTPSTRVPRSAESAKKEFDQAVRSRYRALLLTIKAKLESVEAGIETFEESFMAQIVLPDGRTMGEVATPQIALAYSDNVMPPLLGTGGSS